MTTITATSSRYFTKPNPDNLKVTGKRDFLQCPLEEYRCVYGIIFCQKNAKNNSVLTKATHRTVSRPNCLKRLRYFIEHSAWEERALAYEAKADRLCLGILIASIFCLAPILIKIFLR